MSCNDSSMKSELRKKNFELSHTSTKIYIVKKIQRNFILPGYALVTTLFCALVVTINYARLPRQYNTPT